MDELMRDLRYALRGVRKAPGFTLVAVVTIALGIGVNSTIFSLVNAVLLRPLPVEAPGELVDVYGHTATSSSHDSNSYPNLVDYREQATTLSGVVGYTNFFANLSIEGSSELVVGELVTEGYFDVLGVRPAAGRSFASEEFSGPGAGPVAVVSHAFWQSRFGGAPDAVGRTLRLNGITYTVVGVAPRSFRGMMPGVTAQMWIPVTMVDEVEPLGNQRVSGPGEAGSFLERRGRHFLWIRARRNPGVEVAQVRAELEGIASRLAAEYPDTNERERVWVVPTNDVAVNPDLDGTVAPVGLVLLGAVGLVLLVACANLANMMLARGQSRQRELAIRTAMGAGRGRLLRQLLTESMILALAGGVLALLLSMWLAGLAARFQPPLPVDLGIDVSPDWRVMVFTFAVAAVAGVVFGLVPALRASRPDLVPALKDAGSGESGRPRAFELRDGLVVVQVAVSVVLLVGGALLVRSVGAADDVDFGYDPDRIAHLALVMEMNGYDQDEAAVFVRDARLRLEALPEVEAVGLTSRVPLSLNNNGFGIYLDGHQGSPDDPPYALDGARVDASYFDAMGLDIVAGRGIEAADGEEGRRVAVVTEAMAERFWPGEDAVGRELRRSWDGEPWRVVGIVQDYKVDTPGETPTPYLHIPLNPASTYANFLVRTTLPAGPLVPRLERELRTMDPDLVFVESGTQRTLAEVRLFPVRAGAWLIGVFGGLALVLAGVGLYGVIGYAVSRRVREIGIRKALGARSGEVVGLVVRRGMLLVGAGALLGVVLAALGGRVLSSALYVEPLDPPSFAVALAVLAVVGVLAHWLPARRASGVDPADALRAG